MTYATPLIASLPEMTSSTRACTVDASRLRMRSTPEEARLLAMAVPFDVNSWVICARSVRTETYQVTAASGTSRTVRKTMIFVSRPIRIRSLSMASPLDLNRRRPVGDRHPALAIDAREVHRVEPLMPLGPEGHRRTDSEIEVAERFQRLPERRARGLRTGPAQRLHDDLGVHEPLEADEAHLLHVVVRVAQRLGHGGVVALHERAVLGDSGERRVVVARHPPRGDEPARGIASAALSVLHEQLEHRGRPHEGHGGD